MQNTVFLHAHATNIGNGQVAVMVNVSTTGGSEASAVGCFKQAARKLYKNETGQDVAIPSHEIRLLAARPASETQRILNAVKKYSQSNHAGVFVDVLRKNCYNKADSKQAGVYCPDAHRAIKSLTKQARGW